MAERYLSLSLSLTPYKEVIRKKDYGKIRGIKFYKQTLLLGFGLASKKEGTHMTEVKKRRIINTECVKEGTDVGVCGRSSNYAREVERSESHT